MQTTRSLLWIGIILLGGIIAYGLGAAVLGPFVLSACIIVGSWVGFLAVAAWQVTVRGHKTAGRALVWMAVIAAVLSLYLVSWLSTGKWWLGWVGVPIPPPFRVIEMCDGAGCASHFATQTAEAPHPPAWWPWGH